jgi:hypothetical protein
MRRAGGILMICALAGVAIGQQPAPFASSSMFLTSPREDVIRTLRLQHPDAGVALDRMVVDDMHALDAITQFTTDVWLVDSGQLSSHPTVGVIVSRMQIDSIRRRVSAQAFPAILRLLLAHEKAHQIQYRVYSTALVNRPAQERAIYEAQADILGGKDLTETFADSAFAGASETDALKVLFDLGTEQYSLADHPSHEARRTAVRLGMAAGMITNWSRLAQQATPDIASRAMQNAQLLVWKLDMQNEQTLPWSLRQAMRITNYKRPAIADLVLANDSIAWNRNGHPAVVTYDATYRNVGSKTLVVDMEVKCVSVPRDDPEDTMRWLMISSQSYRFQLAAGQSHTIHDRQQWDATAELMPRLVVPPAPTALITARYLNDTGDDNEPPMASLRFGTDTLAIARLAVNYMLAAAATDFRALLASPGEQLEDVREYASSVGFPGAVRTSIWIPDETNRTDGPELESLMLHTAELADADAFTERLASILGGALGNGWTSRSGGSSNSYTRFEREGSPVVFWVSRGRRTEGHYDVSLRIEKVVADSSR